MVVVFQIFTDDVTKLLFVCQDQFVEAFSLNGLVEGFDIAIVLWLARRDAFRAASDGFEDTLELLREKRIVVMGPALRRHRFQCQIANRPLQPQVIPSILFLSRRIVLPREFPLH